MMFNELGGAMQRAARDLATGWGLWHALWPVAVSFVLWLVLGLSLWTPAREAIASLLPLLPWEGWEWLTHWAAAFLLLVALALLAYATTLFLVAVVSLPLMMNRIAARDFPDLSRQGHHVLLRSLGNSLLAGLIFVVGSLLTLPLLLIPGAIFVIPLTWTTWLNQRTFRFDALAEHANAEEMTQLFSNGRSGFLAAGLACALLAHVPLLNLLAPVYTALVFVHLALARLRALRQKQGITL